MISILYHAEKSKSKSKELEHLNALKQLFSGHICLVARALAVIVNGLYRVVQEVGNLGTVVDAQPHEGIDSELGRQELAGLWHNFFTRQKKCVEIGHEIRKNFKKHLVEILE